MLSNNAGLKTATWLLYCLRLRSRSPHNAQHSTSNYWGERERAPSCGLNGRARCHARYIYVRHPILRMRGATRKRSRPDRELIQLSQHFQPTEVRRQRSRSPLSPILATESATVRLFFILSVLLCSVNKAGLKTETWLLYCLRLDFAHARPGPISNTYVITSLRNGIGNASRALVIYCTGMP